MLIKSVKMEGFRSFSSEEVTFKSGMNVVVGKNGAGKSSLFEALAFVLLPSPYSSKISSLLLHEGSQKVDMATVEVILDNSSNRLAYPEEEVIVKRTMGHKHRGFYIQGKSARMEDWLSIMEVAGFSRSNPYHIIKQGQINDLAVCSDVRRLEIIHELSGVNQFDKKIDRALEKLESAERMLMECNEQIHSIDEEIEKLRVESEIFNTFIQLDKKKQTLEFALAQKRRDEYVKNQALLAQEIQEKEMELAKKGPELEDLETELENSQRNLQLQEQSKAKNLFLYENLQENLTKNKETCAKLEVEIKSKREDLQVKKDDSKKCKMDIAQLESLIYTKEAELEKVKAKFDEAELIHRENEYDMTSIQQKHDGMFTLKQKEFRDAEEKKKWVTKQRLDLTNKIFEIHNGLKSLEGEEVQKINEKREVHGLLKNLQSEEKEIQKVKSNLQNSRGEIEKKIIDLEYEKHRLSSENIQLQQDLKEANDKKNMQRQKLLSNQGVRSSVIGLESMEKVLDFLNAKGRAPPVVVVATVISSRPELHIAISACLGKQLFALITRTANDATLLHQTMKEMKLPGEVAIIALDKLFVRNLKYPSHHSRCEKLMDKVLLRENGELSEDNIKKAMAYLLGPHLLVKSTDDFKMFKDYQLDCVTLAGDQSSRYGVLKGGYYKTGQSLLDKYFSYASAKNDEKSCENKLEKHHVTLSNLEDYMRKLTEEEQKERDKIDRIKDKLDMISRQERVLHEKFASFDDLLRLIAENCNDKKLELVKVKIEQEMLESFVRDSQNVSSQECRDNQNMLEKIKQKYKISFRQKTELEREKHNLQSILVNDLYKQLNNVKESCPTPEQINNLDAKISSIRLNIDNIKTVEKLWEKNKSEIKVQLDFAIQKASESKFRIDDLLLIVEEKRCQFNDISDGIDKLREKKGVPSVGMTKGDGDYDASIDPLVLETYSKWSSKQLFKEMKKIRRNIEKKYSKLNKQAAEQFTKTVELKENATRRESLYLEDRQEQMDLIDILRSKRNEKIHFTYGQIEKYFTEIFTQLVPLGEAKMSFTVPEMSSQIPTGVSVSVKFNRDQEPTSNPNQLSGGQKSVLSLTFILAIQKVDPSPFYIMDEIDAALDEKHRARVAKWMSEQKVQFICTTFRKEFLEQAEHFIAVKYFKDSKTSRAKIVSGEQALLFINSKKDE